MPREWKLTMYVGITCVMHIKVRKEQHKEKSRAYKKAFSLAIKDGWKREAAAAMARVAHARVSASHATGGVYCAMP